MPVIDTHAVGTIISEGRYGKGGQRATLNKEQSIMPEHHTARGEHPAEASTDTSNNVAQNE